MTIDTLGYVKALEDAGIDRRAAEAHLNAMNGHVLPALATRIDLERVERRLDVIEQRIETGVQRIESIVWKAAFAMLGGGLAIGGFLIRFLR